MRPSSSSSETASARISRSVRSLKSLAIHPLLCQFDGAESAAAGSDGNFAQALGADFGGGVGRMLTALDASHQFVHRQHDEEIDSGADEQERYQRVDEISDQKRSEERRVGKECRSR